MFPGFHIVLTASSTLGNNIFVSDLQNYAILRSKSKKSEFDRHEIQPCHFQALLCQNSPGVTNSQKPLKTETTCCAAAVAAILFSIFLLWFLVAGKSALWLVKVALISICTQQ